MKSCFSREEAGNEQEKFPIFGQNYFGLGHHDDDEEDRDYEYHDDDEDHDDDDDDDDFAAV